MQFAAEVTDTADIVAEPQESAVTDQAEFDANQRCWASMIACWTCTTASGRTCRSEGSVFVESL